jgi:hypothetical protein
MFEWLNPLKQFIVHMGGEIVVDNVSEVVVVVPVLDLIRILTPIQDFYLTGQRSIDEERVESMYMFQVNEYKTTGHYSIATTMISLGYCSTLHNPKVLDGQHRLAVLRRVGKFYPNTLTNERTFIKIFKVESETDMLERFQIINRNYVPVPLYNLDENLKAIVDGVIRWFRLSFDLSFFRTPPTGEVLRPHINLDGLGKNLRDWLSDNKRVQDLVAGQNVDISKSIQLICDKLESRNNYLKNRNSEDFMISERDASPCNKAHQKCLSAKKQLFLGMKKNHELIEEALIIRKILTVKKNLLI